MVMRQTFFIHNCETASYLYDLEKSPIFSNRGDESDLKYEQAYIANKITANKIIFIQVIQRGSSEGNKTSGI